MPTPMHLSLVQLHSSYSAIAAKYLTLQDTQKAVRKTAVILHMLIFFGFRQNIGSFQASSRQL
jgi:hypothetical protein